MTVFRFFGPKNQLNRAKPLACLTLLLLFTFITALAQAHVPDDVLGPDATLFEVKVKDEAELIDMLSLTQKIVSTPRLYAYLNEVFKEHLTVSLKLQKEYGWPSTTKGLSETQILFLLKNLPDYESLAALLERYIEKIVDFKDDDPRRDEFVAQLKKEFQSVLADGDVVAHLKAMNDPAKTLTIGYKNRKAAFSDVTVHFNQPTLIDSANPKLGFKPAEDLKQLIIDAIGEAKKTISINIFEFNLMEIANALEDALKRGVQVRVGVDKNTTHLAAENMAVTAKLIELHRKYRGQMKLTLVDPTGLSHQKIVNIDAGTKDAKFIFSSGNFTQSCIGPEGDASKLPPEKRPAKSIPNANHIVISRGALPTLIIEHELNKTLDQKLRGQRGYPISGSYSFSGNKIRKTGKTPIMGIAFSPNGGMGDVSASIIRPLLLNSMGQIFMMQFVASAPVVLDTILEIAAKDPKKFDFKFVGDPPFAMQSWSIPLLLSMMDRDEVTKKYFENPDSPLHKIFNAEQIENLRNNIRLNPNKFGEFHYKVEGEQLKITVKMHHKIFILPRIDLAIIGTSFNPSASAEGNQEQFLWIKDHPVVKQVTNAFFTEFILSSTTVMQQTERRNKYIDDPKLILPKHGKTRNATEMAPQRESEEDFDIMEIRKDAADLESRQVSKDAGKHSKNKCIRYYNK